MNELLQSAVLASSFVCVVLVLLIIMSFSLPCGGFTAKHVLVMLSLFCIWIQAKQKQLNLHRKKHFTDRLAELCAHHDQATNQCGNELRVNESDAKLCADECSLNVEQSSVEQRVKNIQLGTEQCIDTCQPTNERRIIWSSSEMYCCDSDKIGMNTVISGQLNGPVSPEIDNNRRKPVAIESVSLERGVVWATDGRLCIICSSLPFTFCCICSIASCLFSTTLSYRHVLFAGFFVLGMDYSVTSVFVFVLAVLSKWLFYDRIN